MVGWVLILIIDKKVENNLPKKAKFEDLNEELLHRLVEVIEVKEDNEVVIHYKFMNPLSIVV